ncbi:hypothetical protein [Paraburkholderia acidisoli]|uniref:hypothetical protein n=1 Tax=Paraburkholderia acidisoli TaxID=2571748 RepID=UPI001E28418F|nr:hypothetical protein [Paraburkholderia acidisoli]
MSDTAKKLQQIQVVRDEDGYFHHPDLRHFWDVTMGGAEHCTKEQWQAFEAEAGVKTQIVYLESEDMNHPAYVEYFEKGGGVGLESGAAFRLVAGRNQRYRGWPVRSLGNACRHSRGLNQHGC